LNLTENNPGLLPDTPATSKRLLSLDAMRGFIMVMLALESTGLYQQLILHSRGGFMFHFWMQFTHYPWHGLHFWDLIQPGFMFIAGTAMAFSLHKQRIQGKTWNQSFQKALRRSFWLFFWGVLDYAVRGTHLSFELWDVLTQLSFTMLVAFLIFDWPARYQVLASIGLLVLTELLYRCIHIPGFSQPFTDQHNFGNYVDLQLMHKINRDGWVAINCIPTAAHTIWGALAGKILLEKERKNKVFLLVIAGLAALACGYGLDLSGITPIIKRIATSSFVLVSGGYCLLGLAFFYWWIDILGHRRHLMLFTILGMNSIFIYLFFEIVGDRWFTEYVRTISGGLLKLMALPEVLVSIVSCLSVFALEWLLCYFLYRKKIFFKV
jgi:predicted acyltransferase